MKAWRLLQTPADSGAWNMAVDEAILEHIHRGTSKPTLRLYAWNPPCLSLGHAQSFKDVDVERIRSLGWEVVRRLTGGRAILHTDELTYSVAGTADDPVLAGGVLESYNRLSKALVHAIRALNLPVEVKEHEGTPVAHNMNPICFEVPSTYEITVNGKKLIGSAQARRKEGVLQHGSLPLTGDLTRICDALVFEDEPARQNAKDRLLACATTVESVLGVETSWGRTAQVIIQGFEAELGIRFESEELSNSELKLADKLANEKYAHPDWTERN